MAGDLDKKMQLLERRGSLRKVATALSPGSLAVAAYRFGAWTKNEAPPPLAPLCKLAYFALTYPVQAYTGISIQAYAKIGKRFVVLNRSNIFVVAERIGDDFTVCQGVTVGNIRGASSLPVIGNNVFLEPGCKVLGAVTLGDNVIVRANSVVISDVPSNSIAIGNPARVVPAASAEAAEPKRAH